MKFNKLALSAVIASACFASSAMAASEGTINFEGELVATTCDITVNGQPSPALVTLPTVSVSNLAAAGKTTGTTGFTIGLENCAGVTATNTAAAFFENGTTVDFNSYNLINTAPAATAATSVQLQLLDAQTGNKINIGNSDQIVNTTRFDISSGSTVLPYSVQYFATGATTPGLVTSAVNFSIDYQ